MYSYLKKQNKTTTKNVKTIVFSVKVSQKTVFI